MSRKELNETLVAIARSRKIPDFTGGEYMRALDELKAIERELSQAIYDESEKEETR